MSQRIEESGLQVAKPIHDLVNQSILPGTGVTAAMFWAGFAAILAEFGPKNKALLDKREVIQSQIDEWHLARKNTEHNHEEYKVFLKEIGYIVPDTGDFTISTSDVDDEIKTIAGPQLVVPVMNARFALNAANARWGSLYDALYGTDVISEDNGATKVGAYNPVRGDKVIAFAKDFLDSTIPLVNSSFANVNGFDFGDETLSMSLNDGSTVSLVNQESYMGYVDSGNDSFGLLFKNNNLHFEIQIDKSHPIGKSDPAGIKDILIESAITTIQDAEDSVAAVDGADKTVVYRNWLGLMKGSLQETFLKNGQEMTRELSQDRSYKSPQGQEFTLPEGV